MRLSETQIAVLKSYARAVFIAWSMLATTGTTNWRAYVWALALAVLPPSIRAIDPTDAGFGRVAKNVESLLRERLNGQK
jgi:hypothetical protein